MIAQSDPDYAIVGGPAGSAPREYDTDTSKYTYTGTGGVPIGNWLNRCAFAAKFAERNILFSGAIGSESKMIFHRDPKERVQQVAPWLTTDANAVSGGGRRTDRLDRRRLHHRWTLPVRAAQFTRTAGDHSPQAYIRHGKQVSYMRNSVKATVDAYDGTVTLYQVDENDPVLQAWMRVFPGTVKPEDDDPRRTARPLPIPRGSVQHSARHCSRSTTSTNRASSSPPTPSGRCPATRPTTPTHINRPSTSSSATQQTAEPSFRLTSAMVGFNREFLSAYISARSDPDNYGKLTVLQAADRHPDPRPATDTELDDLRHPGSVRTDPARAVQPDPLRQPAYPADRRRRRALRGTAVHRTDLHGSQQLDVPAAVPRTSELCENPGTGGVRVGYAPTLAEALDQVFGPGTGRVATAPGGDPATAPPPPAAPPERPATPHPRQRPN